MLLFTLSFENKPNSLLSLESNCLQILVLKAHVLGPYEKPQLKVYLLYFYKA